MDDPPAIRGGTGGKDFPGTAAFFSSPRGTGVTVMFSLYQVATNRVLWLVPYSLQQLGIIDLCPETITPRSSPHVRFAHGGLSSLRITADHSLMPYAARILNTAS